MNNLHNAAREILSGKINESAELEESTKVEKLSDLSDDEKARIEDVLSRRDKNMPDGMKNRKRHPILMFDKKGQYHGSYASVSDAKKKIKRVGDTEGWINGPRLVQVDESTELEEAAAKILRGEHALNYDESTELEEAKSPEYSEILKKGEKLGTWNNNLYFKYNNNVWQYNVSKEVLINKGSYEKFIKPGNMNKNLIKALNLDEAKQKIERGDSVHIKSSGKLALVLDVKGNKLRVKSPGEKEQILSTNEVDLFDEYEESVNLDEARKPKKGDMVTWNKKTGRMFSLEVLNKNGTAWLSDEDGEEYEAKVSDLTVEEDTVAGDVADAPRGLGNNKMRRRKDLEKTVELQEASLPDGLDNWESVETRLGKYGFKPISPNSDKAAPKIVRESDAVLKGLDKDKNAVWVGYNKKAYFIYDSNGEIQVKDQRVWWKQLQKGFKNGYFTETFDIKDLKESIGGGHTSSDISSGSKWKMFDVPMETFRKFETGRIKYERWGKFLNLEDETQRSIYDYARTKRENVIVLRCSDTGALRAIRRRTQDGM